MLEAPGKKYKPQKEGGTPRPMKHSGRGGKKRMLEACKSLFKDEACHGVLILNQRGKPVLAPVDECYIVYTGGTNSEQPGLCGGVYMKS